MRFYSIHCEGRDEAAVLVNDRIVRMTDINARLKTDFATNLLEFIRTPSSMARLRRALTRIPATSKAGMWPDEVDPGPPVAKPPKIWGIGLNYRDHASDLSAPWPVEPASFMKPGTTVIGPNDNIVLPPDSNRVTAEAELGIVIGKRCKNVNQGDARSVIFGYVPLLDMTAEDILQRNPRFLTRAKSYDTFLSLGPCIVTPDEIQEVEELSISTVVNGEVKHTNKVKNMAFLPDYLVALHSRIFTFEPGDIILTGTPGAAKISDGDQAECRIDGFPPLRNPVKEGGEG
jgi:2-keto-4-pentenoate hydratase/2-oxohepta-3-ene-1,7-dioic acid hydratase in catechol pathway